MTFPLISLATYAGLVGLAGWLIWNAIKNDREECPSKTNHNWRMT